MQENKEQKVCVRCLLPKDMTEFYQYSIKNRPKKYADSRCRTCRYAHNKERYGDCLKASRYKLKRGQLVQMSTVCEICESTERLCFDHDHKSGDVRGRLCVSCNAGLGMFRESSENLTKAIRYLDIVANREPYNKRNVVAYVSPISHRKVNDEAVRELVSLTQEGKTPEELAKLFGITAGYVKRILQGKARSNVSGLKKTVIRRILTEDELLSLRKDWALGMKQKDLASKYKLDPGYVSALVWGKRRALGR